MVGKSQNWELSCGQETINIEIEGVFIQESKKDCNDQSFEYIKEIALYINELFADRSSRNTEEIQSTERVCVEADVHTCTPTGDGE